MTLWTPTQWTTGETLTASKLNTISGEAATNDRPSTIEDHSANAAGMRTTTDPGESGSESLATNLAGELERLRYSILDIKGTGGPITYWYETPAFKTSTGGTIQSTDAGATAGPTIVLWRNSASPADDDLLGQIDFDGEDDGGNQTTYFRMVAEIDDATDTTEDGTMRFWQPVAGTLANTYAFAQGFFDVKSTDATATAAPTMRLYRDSASPLAADAIGQITFVGKDAGDNDTTYASIGSVLNDVTDTTEDGELVFKVMTGGTLTTQMVLDEEGIKDSNDRLMQSALSSRAANTGLTTSPSEHTGIRSDVSIIDIVISLVSPTGASTANLEMVLGDSGGYTVSGYTGADLMRVENGIWSDIALPLDAFFLADSLEGNSSITGNLTLTNPNANRWVLSGTLSDSDKKSTYVISQHVGLAGTLDRIKLQTSNGDSWDLGTFAIFPR